MQLTWRLAEHIAALRDENPTRSVLPLSGCEDLRSDDYSHTWFGYTPLNPEYRVSIPQQ